MKDGFQLEREFRNFILDAINIDIDDTARWVGNNLNPEEVFSEDDLADWALKNGFVREV